MITAKISTIREINGRFLLLQNILLLFLIIGLLYSDRINNFSPLIFDIVRYILILISFIDFFSLLIWMKRNHIEKGIKYSFVHYFLVLRIRTSLLDAGYFVKRQFFGIDVAKLPKINLKMDENYSYGKVEIKNEIKYEKRLDNIEISSSLGKYIVEFSYLSDDENYYVFEIFNSKINRRLTFNSSKEFIDYSAQYNNDTLFIDSINKVKLHHTLIVGQTGSGKTYALYSLILQLINKKVHCNLFISDPKASSLSVIGDKIIPENTSEDIDDIIQSLRQFNMKMNERKNEIKEKLLSKIESSYVDFDFEPYVFIFDEYASFQSVIQSRDKKTRDEVNKLISQIVLQGRQLGFFLFVVMQKSDSTSLPTMIRDNLPLKIVLGNAEEQTYITAFGYSKDIPKYKFRRGEGVYTFPEIANNPKICSFSYLNFDILGSFNKAGGVVNTPAPPKNRKR